MVVRMLTATVIPSPPSQTGEHPMEEDSTSKERWRSSKPHLQTSLTLTVLNLWVVLIVIILICTTSNSHQWPQSTPTKIHLTSLLVSSQWLLMLMECAQQLLILLWISLPPHLWWQAMRTRTLLNVDSTLSTPGVECTRHSSRLILTQL